MKAHICNAHYRVLEDGYPWSQSVTSSQLVRTVDAVEPTRDHLWSQTVSNTQLYSAANTIDPPADVQNGKQLFPSLFIC